MTRILIGCVALGLAAALGAPAAGQGDEARSVLGFTMKSLEGKDVDLGTYRGKVVLIVNVASKCGLTPQYEQLQALHEKHARDGLVVLGFPCNQFREQEPGSPEEIREFCSVSYGVEFPLMAKIDVNGDGACPLYKRLTSLDTEPQGPGAISWNFEKFLVNREGEVVARFAPRTRPDDPALVTAIEAALKSAAE